jgi:hypothetical protein
MTLDFFTRTRQDWILKFHGLSNANFDTTR